MSVEDHIPSAKYLSSRDPEQFLHILENFVFSARGEQSVDIRAMDIAVSYESRVYFEKN
jgi:hypothetical protein